MWSLLATIIPATEDPQRVMKYMQHIDKLDFPDIPIHVQVGGIPKFDTRNDISIYVFGYEKRETHPLHLTGEGGLKHMDFFVLTREDKSHYCLIKKINILINMYRKEINYFIVIIISMGFLKSGFKKNTCLIVKYTVHSGPKCETIKTNGSSFALFQSSSRFHL